MAAVTMVNTIANTIEALSSLPVIGPIVYHFATRTDSPACSCGRDQRHYTGRC